MVHDLPRMLMSIELRSEPDAIEADWLEADSHSRTASLSALRQYAQQHRSGGPPARIELPQGHPHRSEYSYDSSSKFAYVRLTVLRDGEQLLVETDYATGPVSQAGGDGRPVEWSRFLSALITEIDNRDGDGE